MLHPLRVMLRLEDETDRVVAILHDAVENGFDRVPLDRLRHDGYPDEVVDAVDRLTRRPGEPYAAFVERIAPSPLARRVKLADLADNLQWMVFGTAEPDECPACTTACWPGAASAPRGDLVKSMPPNLTKEKLLRGEAVFGCIMPYPDPALVELMGVAGIDFVRFEGEHGPATLDQVEHCVRAAELFGVTRPRACRSTCRTRSCASSTAASSA